MEQRNVDFQIEVTRDQWDQLGRTAASLGPEEGGYEWSESDPGTIHALLRDDDAPDGWRRFLADERHYGAHERRIAEFRFNAGRPYGRVDVPDHLVDPPAVTEAEEREMEVTLYRWVREKWHRLMRDSGLHHDRGHIPQG